MIQSGKKQDLHQYCRNDNFNWQGNKEEEIEMQHILYKPTLDTRVYSFLSEKISLIQQD